MRKHTLITKPAPAPAASSDALDAFVNGAPDAGAERKAEPAKVAQPDVELPRELRKRKEPITVTVAPHILHAFDKTAASMGLSRAAALGMAMNMFLQEHEKGRA